MRSSASAMGVCHAAPGMTSSIIAVACTNTSSASLQRPTRHSNDALTLSQWWLRNAGEPGAVPTIPRRSNLVVHDSTRSRSAVW